MTQVFSRPILDILSWSCLVVIYIFTVLSQSQTWRTQDLISRPQLRARSKLFVTITTEMKHKTSCSNAANNPTWYHPWNTVSHCHSILLCFTHSNKVIVVDWRRSCGCLGGGNTSLCNRNWRPNPQRLHLQNILPAVLGLGLQSVSV